MTMAVWKVVLWVEVVGYSIVVSLLGYPRLIDPNTGGFKYHRL